MGGRADEDEYGNAPEPVAAAEYIRSLAAYQAQRSRGHLAAGVRPVNPGGNKGGMEVRYGPGRGGLTGAFREMRVGGGLSDDDSGSESDGEDDRRGMRVMGRATVKARSHALLEVKGGWNGSFARRDENARTDEFGGQGEGDEGVSASTATAPRVDTLRQHRSRTLPDHVTDTRDVIRVKRLQIRLFVLHRAAIA